MKKLIITRADSAIKEMTDITHPLLKKFAKKWGCDFLPISNNADCSGNGRFHYRIMECYDLYNKYDRIISLDSDVILTPKCPNLFETVPDDCVGTIYEDKGTRAKDRRKRIKLAQERFGDIGWKEGYINTGVFLTSKRHQDIFAKIDGQYWDNLGFDDVHLGYQINKGKHKVMELPFKFNHMSMFSEPWNKNANRFNSFIIHYAGVGVFDKGENRISQMKKDYNKLWGNK